MDITIDNIKEVSIVTEFNFANNKCSDLLRISKKWISYSRECKSNSHINDSWSYQTNRNLEDKFKNLLGFIVYDLINKTDLITIPSDDMFNIRVTLNDNTYTNYKGYGTFKKNGLEELSFLILNMINGKDKCSPLINMFNKEQLTDEILSKIDKNTVLGLMTAESGAMGSPGEIKVLCEYTVYSTNLLFENTCSPKNIFSLYDGLDSFEGSPVDICLLIINDDVWIYLYLGFGNHLYLNYSFYKKYSNLIYDAEAPNRYTKWNMLIKEY